MSSVNLKNLSIEELKKMVKKKNEEMKKLEQEKEKEKLILAYKKLQNKEEKLSQEKNQIISKSKSKSKTKSKPISKQKSKSKSKSKQKEKGYDEDFQECIKNKTIPKDAPAYFTKALIRAKKEYEKGIKLETSALRNLAEKYVIDGKPGLKPLQYFAEKVARIKDFLRNHRNIKVRMLLICLMERKIIEKSKGESKIRFEQDKAYFQSETYINLEKNRCESNTLFNVIRNYGKNSQLYKKWFRLVFQRSNQF